MASMYDRVALEVHRPGRILSAALMTTTTTMTAKHAPEIFV